MGHFTLHSSVQRNELGPPSCFYLLHFALKGLMEIEIRSLSEALYTDFLRFSSRDLEISNFVKTKGNLLCKSYLEIKMSKIEIRPKIMVYCVISV